MFDEKASSPCESENVIYRLFHSFLKGRTQEEAFDALKDDKPNDLDDTQEDE